MASESIASTPPLTTTTVEESFQNAVISPTSVPASGFDPPQRSFAALYTIQPNLTTRAAQLEIWSSLITEYCAHHRIFRISLSATPPGLFSNPKIRRALKPSDVRLVLDHLSKVEGGQKIEWIPPTVRGELSNSCYVYWKTPSEWADAIYAWVDNTGQRGSVLTLYEIRESDGVSNQAWFEMDETLLRKVLNVLVKRGKAQIFGQEDGAGIKFF